MKSLIIGKNYGGVFGLDSNKGKKMIYNGGDNWIGINGDKTQSLVSPQTTQKVLEYINRPSVNIKG